MIKFSFMVVGFDETLTGGEMLMTLCEWVVPWRVPLTRSSDKTRIEGTGYHSREEALTGVRKASNKSEGVCCCPADRFHRVARRRRGV
jgi:hypothetical protein